jgi:hypothetical protein
MADTPALGSGTNHAPIHHHGVDCDWPHGDRGDKSLSKYRRVVGALLWLSLSLWASACEAQFSPASTGPGAKYLCNVPVRDSVQLLRRQIEDKLGKVKCETVVHMGGEFGLSGVDTDGVPFIKLDQQIGTTEEVVAHELLHLYLRSEGWKSKSTDGASGCARVYIGSEVWSEIGHRAMAKRARSLGFDADEHHRRELKRLLAAEGFDPTFVQFPQLAALTFEKMMRVDPEGARNFAPMAERQGMASAVQAGRELYSILQKGPNDRAAADHMFEACNDLIWKDLPHYAISERVLCSHANAASIPH